MVEFLVRVSPQEVVNLVDKKLSMAPSQVKKLMNTFAQQKMAEKSEWLSMKSIIIEQRTV